LKHYKYIYLNTKLKYMYKNLLLTAIFAVVLTKLFAQNLKASEENALIHVKVTDMADQIRENDIIHFVGTKRNKSYEGISNKEGKFDILLPEGDIYQVKIIGLGKEEEYNTLEIGSDKGFYEAEIIIGYDPATVFKLEDVHFDINKASLRPESFKALDKLAQVLTIKNNLKVEIAGHTDSDGDEEENMKLSQSRAESVIKYLITKGITKERLIAVGYGESEPIAENDTASGKQENRRTEARILE
jgi:outer membrane protein OmpA-like peptidoglycan-associated protein